MEYELIRSRRKTLAVEYRGGKMLVRAPLLATKGQIDRFLAAHREQIEAYLEKERARETECAGIQKLTPEAHKALVERAKEVIPRRVAYYAPLVGVDYGRVTVRSQRTRWGSCSAKGNLSFNCLLMLAPPKVLDGVVVHELCHRREPNHSPRFYAEVLRVLPDYRTHEKWLKENGRLLLARLDGQSGQARAGQ